MPLRRKSRFGRRDAGGLAGWTERLDNGVSRAQVLNGFIYSQEFGNLASSYGILVDSDAGLDDARLGLRRLGLGLRLEEALYPVHVGSQGLD